MTIKPLIVTGLVGSLRTGSYSAALMRHLADALPAGSDYAELPIGEVPHYNEDHDDAEDAATGETPAIVTEARARITASDAVLIVTPEFNHGIPGVLKNTLDWLSRPAFNSCFLAKPVFFATHSPGPLGGVRAQYQMRETMASMLCNLVPLREIAITHVAGKLADGGVSDAATDAQLRRSLGQFLAAIGRA